MNTLIHSLILGLRGLRARITTRQHTRWRFASTVALCLIAAAALLLIDGFVILGIAVFALGGLASWLTGIWVMPGGVDGYYRRISRILRDIQIQSQQHQDTNIRELKSLTHSIAQLSKEGESYREILAECKRIDDTITDKGINFDRAQEVAKHHRRLLKFGESFEQGRAGPTNRPLAMVFVRRASVIVGMFDTAQELLGDQVRHLTRIKVPATLSDQHQRYVEVLNAYVLAFGEVCKAIFQNSDGSLDGLC